jgi:hypothetical protein
MKRIAAFLLLVLGLACLKPVQAQIFMGPDSTRQAQKAAKKQQKAFVKRAKKQQKALRKYQKAQRKAEKRQQHRTG